MGNIKGSKRNSGKLIYGVGVCDAITINPKTGERLKSYTLWKAMLRRSYSRSTPSEREKHKSYDNVSVCERWHKFSSFLEDLPLIEGYEEWIKNEVRMTLDKDLKQKGVENKVYSLETCVFISQAENTRIAMQEATRQTRSMISIDVNNYNNKQIHNNVNSEYGKSSSNICACANNRQQSAYGYRWFYADKYESMCNEIDDKFQALEDRKINLSWIELQQLYNLIQTGNFHKLNDELDKILINC